MNECSTPTNADLSTKTSSGGEEERGGRVVSGDGDSSDGASRGTSGGGIQNYSRDYLVSEGSVSVYTHSAVMDSE